MRSTTRDTRMERRDKDTGELVGMSSIKSNSHKGGDGDHNEEKNGGWQPFYELQGSVLRSAVCTLRPLQSPFTVPLSFFFSFKVSSPMPNVGPSGIP